MIIFLNGWMDKKKKRKEKTENNENTINKNFI